jgi:DNA-directed RNA polymerase subunit beta'
MPRLDPAESQKALQDGVREAIQDVFPLVGSKHTLKLVDVKIVDPKDPADIKAQKEAKLQGRTFGSDVKATFHLVDNATGQVLDKSTRKVATIPDITRRLSYIVGGSEYQVKNLWTLKPGIYTRVKQNGELESQINVKGGGFHVGFDPHSKKFTVRIGSANPPLYPVLKAIGIDDDTLQRAWGKEILEANRVRNPDKSAIGFAERLSKGKIANISQASEAIRKNFETSELRPDVTQRTIGTPAERITPDVMLRVSQRLLGVSRGDEKPDDRDALMHKELKGVEDMVGDRIRQQRNVIVRKLGNNLDRRDKIGDIVGPDLLNKPVRTFFTKSSLSSTTEMTNPLAMMTGHQQTTIMGDEGGVKSAHRIIEEAKLVNPSHFGFLDPLHTPEGESTGITLHTTLGLRKDGREVKIPLYNIKTGKIEHVGPGQVFDSTVVMPDEVDWKNGKPVPKADRVKASLRGNDIGTTPFSEAHYVLPSTAQVFSPALNLVPFLNNNSQNRATMSGRHQEQAVSLKNRETPLVRSVAGGDITFDDIMGRFTTFHAPVAGTVDRVRPDAITIKDADGKRHTLPIYDHYPLTEKKGFLHSVPVVKAGDKVKSGQLLADSNFTKGDVYAPGVNLRVAYIPARGYNVDDAVVVSESAAKKLTSEHLHKKSLSTADGQLFGTNKFHAYFPNHTTLEQRKKLDDNGVIRVGQTVHPGDTLIAGMSPRIITKDEADLSLIHRSLVKPYKNKAVTWEEPTLGTVIAVHNKPKGIEVHVRTEEPLVVGDKIVSRHANKGLVATVLPDHEMPKTADGKTIDVVHNPIGLAGRMNVGQILETAASKVAEKTGKPYLVKNFGSDDARSQVEGELKKHGLSDRETLIDPKTGKEIPNVVTGLQYTLKLHHQSEDKMSARSRDSYDRNLIPKGGGEHGAQGLGSLELYGMLAHGAKANIREMATWKSDKAQGGDNDALWGALQSGEPLPPPRTTFAYKKFLSYLNALGVNAEKDGNSLTLMPLTDAGTLKMSAGKIKDGGKLVKMRTLEPEKGGLFDPKTTGGDGGTKWSHLELHEKMPNPIFETAIMSLSGIRKPVFNDIVEGRSAVTSDGRIVPASSPGATHGPAGIEHLLKKVDVQAELKKELARVGTLRNQQLNETNKRIKYLKALDKLDMKPVDAYMMKHIPVLPPVLRPISVTDSGSVQFDDVNHLYKNIALLSQKLGELHPLISDEEKAKARFDIYDGMRALAGTGGYLNKRYPGILNVISGGTPKEGYFQDKLVKKKQDLSMRSTIVPDPTLSLDEIGIPRKAAMELYKPFVVRELRQSFGYTPLQAQKLINDGDKLAHTALDRVVRDRPVAVKRDPVLHRYGIQGFKPRLVAGNSIKVHPLVTAGYNADFDGDTMSAFVPISKEAVEEVHKMMPSNMLFSNASGRAAYTPHHEMQVGLYALSEIGKEKKLKFADVAAAEKAHAGGRIGLTDVVTVGGTKTTLGRTRLDSALPESMRGGTILKDLSYRFDKKEQAKVFDIMAAKDPHTYSVHIDKLKDLGNEHVFRSGFSIGLSDLKTHKDIRDPILKRAAEDTKHLDLSRPDHANKFVDIYGRALTEIDTAVKERSKGLHTNLDRLQQAAGIKGDGLRQMTAAPILFTDAQNNPVLTPVTRSYAEGMDTASYWASMSGGRAGIIKKVQSVADPGYLSKTILSATMNTLVTGHDCGTTEGISLPITESDIAGRHLVAPVKLSGNRTIPAGTMLTPDLVGELRNDKIGRVVVRSPLKCVDAKGVCQKCAGYNENGHYHDIGTNVGVLSAQALGERGVQITLRSFHSGGVYDPKGSSLNTAGIERAKELFNLPKTLRGSATLSTQNGTVSAIKVDPAGGWRVHIEGKPHYIPSDRKLAVGVGDKVKKGAPISSGPINPHEMLPLTGITPVQNYLADELHKLYAPEDIKRRHTETVVKAMSNVTRIEDPGDHTDFVRGDFANTTQVDFINKTELKGKKPIIHSPVVKGVRQIPQDVMEDWLARLNHEKLRATVIEGAQRGWSSNLHGEHPIPSMVYGAEFGLNDKPGY